ncbi:MAG TPA: helix-turn-helix transcriptional regulator [Pseudonocardiaceae bacterium]|jgi:DNA-binding CsgD family transcriptional regulator
MTTSANLAGLGLAPRAEQLYRSLLSRSSWPVEGLAERTGFADAEFGQLLALLRDLQLIRDSRNGEVRAVDPQIGLAALVSSRESELADQRWELEQSRLAAAALALEYDVPRAGPSRGSPDIVHGEAAVRAKVAELLGAARTEVVAMSLSSQGYLDPVALSPSACRAVSQRGITVRSVYFDRVRSDQRLTGYLHDLVVAGGFVRTARALPTSALAIDDEVVVVPVALSMTGRRPSAVLLRLPGVVTAIVELFERVWAGASPVGRELGDDVPDGLGDREHRLLGLLLAGCTDESAAARLDVSIRTVGRMVSTLMEALDAHSRFEAGARAVLYGWPAPK